MTKWEQSQGKIVVKLIDKGYNINVSSYAIGTLDATEYDETYTEYRVQKWIEGGIMR